MPEKTWSFAVIVSSASGLTKFFGTPVDLYEDAVKLQKSALDTGWKTAIIVDPTLTEVKTPEVKPLPDVKPQGIDPAGHRKIRKLR
jgi:hypothetical protein